MAPSKKLETIHQDDLPVLHHYPVPGCDATGLRCATFAHHGDYSLWLCRAELEPGAELAIDDNHGDYGIYLDEGELVVGGQTCVPGGAVIIEAGVPARITSPAGATIYHDGPLDPKPPVDGILGQARLEGHCIHVVGPKGWYRSGTKEKVEAVWFADSTCPTCRIALFTVARQPAHARVGRPHSHSADELIHILSGALRLGSQEYGAGTSLVIPADVHYAVSGEYGLKFLNYRSTTSLQTWYDGDRATESETGLTRGGELVNDVVNVTAAA
jgi:hypothetical protein